MFVWKEEHNSFLIELRETDDLKWDEITAKFNAQFNLTLTLNAVRKAYKRIQAGKNATTDQLLVKKLKAEVTSKAKLSELGKINEVLTEEALSQQEFLSSLLDISKKFPIKTHKKTKVSKGGKISRSLVAHISDTHIGCKIDGDEMGGINTYNEEVEARRFALYFKTLANYKLPHRKETELVMVLNGDIFAGIIHSSVGVAPMATQFARGLSIFTQGISFLSQHFKKIRVICQTGNHDRYMHKEEKGRQYEQKWDSFGTNLFVALREGFRAYKNVEFDISSAPYSIVNIQGYNVFITHGDTVVKIGNPGKTLNIESIRKQINDLIAGLGTKIDVLMVGHVHKEVYMTLDNGVDLVINGTLSGTDGFALGAIGITSNHPCQQLFEMTKEHKIGDMRFERLKKADNDEALEKIVEPIRGKF